MSGEIEDPTITVEIDPTDTDEMVTVAQDGTEQTYSSQEAFQLVAKIVHQIRQMGSSSSDYRVTDTLK